MPLNNQPYLPLYVDDWMNNNKLKLCSPGSHGLMISIMCLMHKEEEYGKILLKQKFKQTDKQILNFASQIAKQTSFDLLDVELYLTELITEKVLFFEDDYLICNRMVKMANISNIRAGVGKQGGKQTQLKAKKIKENKQNFAKAKVQANTVIVNVNENVIDNDNIKDNKCEKKERKKRTKKTIFPSKEEIETMIIPEEEIESCKKLSDNILGKEVTTKNDIIQYWQRFKIINFTGEKPYKTNKAIYDHFKNWLNFNDKKIKNNNGKYPTNTTTADRKQQQYDQNNELLRAYEDFTKQSFE